MTQKWDFKLILWIPIVLLLSTIALIGCSTLKKQEFLTTMLQEKINSKLTLTQVKNNPGPYRGEMVLWGGKIIKTVPKEEETTIEVLNLPLDTKQRPQDTDNSEGRFLVLNSGFLDPYIYRQGRDITVVGKILELQKQVIGEKQYSYPVLNATKIHLWEEEKQKVEIYHEPPYFNYWHYRWWRHPYWW